MRKFILFNLNCVQIMLRFVFLKRLSLTLANNNNTNTEETEVEVTEFEKKLDHIIVRINY